MYISISNNFVYNSSPELYTHDTCKQTFFCKEIYPSHSTQRHLQQGSANPARFVVIQA